MLRFPPTMAGETTYTKKELDGLRQRLLEEGGRSCRSSSRRSRRPPSPPSQSDLSGEVSFDEENADAGTFTFERERDLSIENNVRDLMGRSTVPSPTWTRARTVCSRCGKPIEKARLRALPYVDLCLKDAQAQSRR